MVQIKLFDTADISIDDEAVALPYKQAEFVLIYLLLTFPDPVEKDLLAEFIWPGKAPGVARANLRHAIHTLRSALRLPDLIRTTKNQIRFDADGNVDCDYRTVAKLIEEKPGHPGPTSEDVGRLLDLYKNGLLAFSSAEPSPEYGFWLLLKRKDCADAVSSCLLSAVPRLCEHKDHEILSRIAERFFIWDPFNTAPYEYLLSRMISSGELKAALRIHQDVTDLAEKAGEPDALNALADTAGRLFAGESRPASVKKVLPAQLAPFIGREREIEEIGRLLMKPEVRMITVCAPGGYGKTSIAVALGRAMDADSQPDGVFFVSWNSCHDEKECVETLQRRLELSLNGAAPEDVIKNYIRDKKALFIIDEIEDRRFGYPFLEELLTAAPKLKIIATSRQRTELKSEWTYSLHPFSTISDSAEFFLRTVERKTGKTRWSDTEKDFAEKICRRLNGIPLAIEMAAARMADQDIKSLWRRLKTTPEEVLMKDSVLNDVVTYQLNLLTEENRLKYCFLALFQNDFEKKTACAAFIIPEDVFAEYCRLSLLWPTKDGLFGIHSHVRAYALRLLKERDLYDSGSERLYLHLADLSERNFHRLFTMSGDPQEVVLRYPLEIEQGWRFALRRRRWDTALKLVVPLGSYIHYEGKTRKGIELFKNEFEALSEIDKEYLDEQACHVILHIGLVTAIMELQARNAFSARRLMLKMRDLDARGGYGLLMERKGETDLYRQWLFIAFAWARGILALLEGKREKASALFLSGIKKSVRYSAHMGRVYISIYYGMTLFEDDPDKAVSILLDAVKSSRKSGVPGLRSEIYLQLARFYYRLGKIEDARIHAESALEASRSRPGSHVEMEAFFLLGLLYIARKADSGIPKTYLARALENAEKNGTAAIAVESSLEFIRRYTEAYGGPPDMDVYEDIANLANRTGLEKLKAELDRLFSLY